MAEKHYLDQYDSGDPNFIVVDGKISESYLDEEQEIEIKELIGSVIFNYNELESDLDRLIAEIINSRSYLPGYTITAEIGNVFTKKILVFKSLYGQLSETFQDAEFKTEFEALVTLLFSLKDVRNDVVHANWSGANSEYEVRIRHNTDERGPYALLKKMPPDYLNTVIERLEQAIQMLELFDQHRDEVMAHGRILKEEDHEKHQGNNVQLD